MGISGKLIGHNTFYGWPSGEMQAAVAPLLKLTKENDVPIVGSVEVGAGIIAVVT